MVRSDSIRDNKARESLMINEQKIVGNKCAERILRIVATTFSVMYSELQTPEIVRENTHRKGQREWILRLTI